MYVVVATDSCLRAIRPLWQDCRNDNGPDATIAQELQSTIAPDFLLSSVSSSPKYHIESELHIQRLSPSLPLVGRSTARPETIANGTPLPLQTTNCSIRNRSERHISSSQD